MRMAFEYIFTISVGYLLGCSHMAYYIARIKGIDIKKQGSRNYGASNTMALLGWKAGSIVALHDIGKAVLAVVLTGIIFTENPYLPLIAGVSCIVGHIFPFYLGFDGGKGFASFIGMTLALNWKLGVCTILLVIFAVIITDYIVAGTFSSIVIVPMAIGFINRSAIQTIIICVAVVIILYKHEQNIINLLSGTEIKVSEVLRK